METIKCTRCHVSKETTEFAKGVKQFKMCSKCRSHVCSWVCANYKKQTSLNTVVDNAKKCTVCFHTKPVSEFKVIGTHYAKLCNACRVVRSKYPSLDKN